VKEDNQPFKERFTIQDLENLTGIQAHTIRIWEKRYDLLHPLRAGNNIRYYAHTDLVKLLNISALYRRNFKISKIASMSDTELVETVRKISLQNPDDEDANHALKLAMLNYDQPLFDETCRKLSRTMSFREIFHNVFLPLLNEIGLMWQTETITISHEHFLSNLIRQKILLQAEQLQSEGYAAGAKVFVLYLPANEVHELGLLYSHYELLAHGHRSIYLGQSVPIEALLDLHGVYPQITFITSFTTQPADDKLEDYLKKVSGSILRKGKDELWVSGRKIHTMTSKPKLAGIKYIMSPDDFLKAIEV
jgi:DNA-binding transcriptional MerR regulator